MKPVKKLSTKMKPVKLEDEDNDANDYDDEQSALAYPGTRGIALPQVGKQQIKGKRFSGVY